MSKVVIIGAGASGLTSAIFASEQNEVIILESKHSIGKKITVSGNGRCNYFNENINSSFYETSDKDILDKILSQKNITTIKEFFKKIGIIPLIKDGYYYPSSNTAFSVKEALELECKLRGVKIICDYEVTSIKKNNKFIINNEIYADKVILATGSSASFKDYIPKGYNIARFFNHSITKLIPALTGLQGEGKYLKIWSGVRSDVIIELFIDGNKISEEEGQIQLTDYGVSGVCAFNLSIKANTALALSKSVHLKINFIPFLKLNSTSSVLDYLENRNKMLPNRNLIQLLEGMLNYKLVKAMLESINLDPNKSFNKLKKDEKLALARNLYSFDFKVTGYNSFNKAQASLGGIPLKEISPETMESKKIPGLYLTGEILDVCGKCGGYNLGFAFINGMLAGKDV